MSIDSNLVQKFNNFKFHEIYGHKGGQHFFPLLFVAVGSGIRGLGWEKINQDQDKHIGSLALAIIPYFCKLLKSPSMSNVYILT